MSVSKQVTVGVTPTLLYQADGPDPETVALDVQSGTVTVGDEHVVAGRGPQVPTSGPPLVLTLYEDAIYGIVASATASVSVFAVKSGSR